MGCARIVVGVKGTAKGNDPLKVYWRAVGDLIMEGSRGCAGPCGDKAQPGICKFGLTKLHEGYEKVNDADGKGVMITVTGDGECFCG